MYTQQKLYGVLKFQKWVKLLMYIHLHCSQIVKHVVGKILCYVKILKTPIFEISV